MATEFARVQKRYGHWRIEGYDSSETVYKATLPGNLSDAKIIAIVQRLACRHLSETEILGASLPGKQKRNTLLDVQRGQGGPNSRHTISCGHLVHYTASYWKAGEPSC